MMSELYRIGMFAKMNKVTIKTLRYYDEMNLLKPVYIDEETSYRYYSSKQIASLHEIIALKQLGCSLSEIRKIQNGQKPENILRNKKIKLIEEISQKTNMIAQIEYYLNNDKVNQDYNIVIKKLPHVIVASHRRTIPNYGALFKCYPEMGEEMSKLNCEISLPEYCFNIYHDVAYQEENIDIEMCEAVVEAKEDTDNIKFKEILEVEMAACLLHKGSYETIPSAYQKLVEWIEENNYVISDNPRESYIDGIWNKEDIDDWLTEVQIPITHK